MARKPILLVVAIATVALAVPAMAAAAPSLTQPAGTLFPVGGKLAVSASNWTLTSENFHLFTCEQVSQEESVTANNGSAVSTVQVAAGAGTGCMHNGSVLPFKEISLKEISMKEPGKGTASVVISVFVFKGESTCNWSATSAPFTYVTGTSVITFKTATLAPTPLACGAATFDADYKLTGVKSPTVPVVID